MKSAKFRAEEQFAAIKKKAKQAFEETDEPLQKRMKHLAKLRARRLAKEPADKESRRQE